jgi:hypothetical protein
MFAVLDVGPATARQVARVRAEQAHAPVERMIEAFAGLAGVERYLLRVWPNPTSAAVPGRPV